ncbi:uncharacterized protein ATNIH1004_008861 [Aspergillus tanneri]|uniref:Rhodopsin domain-containing protein n=1 Tax=Aspergillus tanneri TaxID=1220188 RepID=A0A5M9MCD4_9EURO|nr:uncharacterized protein ATNIH1004_008861 [Aspergillus tanneri]KAA8644655.1 hypothetical protein ATNIH1004_008861 [Aspergillus tanneri]
MEQLLQLPAAATPPGVRSNFVDPPKLEATGRAVILTFWILCSVVLLVRMYTKIRIIRQVDLSDYSILVAWFVEVFAPVRSGRFYWTCHFLIAVNFIFYLIGFFLELFPCRPREKFWKPWLSGSCLNIILQDVVAGSINSASDIVILVLPQLRIWSLHMPLGRKIAVSAIFLVGAMACAASIVRLAYTVVLYHTDNVSYYSFLAGLWTIPELSMGIMVACLPVMPRFFKSFDPEQRLTCLGSSLQDSLSGGTRHRSQHSKTASKTSYPNGGPGKGESDRYPLVSVSSRGSNPSGAIPDQRPLDRLNCPHHRVQIVRPGDLMSHMDVDLSQTATTQRAQLRSIAIALIVSPPDMNCRHVDDLAIRGRLHDTSITPDQSAGEEEQGDGDDPRDGLVHDFCGLTRGPWLLILTRTPTRT